MALNDSVSRSFYTFQKLSLNWQYWLLCNSLISELVLCGRYEARGAPNSHCLHIVGLHLGFCSLMHSVLSWIYSTLNSPLWSGLYASKIIIFSHHSNQDDMGLGRKAQGQCGGSPALHLIWVKFVLTFSSLSHCFSSPVKGEWTLGFPGQSTGTWITPEAVGSLPVPASSSLLSAMLWCMWSLDITLKQGVE